MNTTCLHVRWGYPVTHGKWIKERFRQTYRVKWYCLSMLGINPSPPQIKIKIGKIKIKIITQILKVIKKKKRNRSKDQNDIWSNLKTWISDHPIFNINLYFSSHQCHLYSVTCLHEYFKYRKSTKQKQKAKPYLHWITLKTLLFKIDK